MTATIQGSWREYEITGNESLGYFVYTTLHLCGGKSFSQYKLGNPNGGGYRFESRDSAEQAIENHKSRNAE